MLADEDKEVVVEFPSNFSKPGGFLPSLGEDI
jgi:hypothetical protein